jgi:hypothetical protein
MTMAKDTKRPPELVDMLAEALQVDIVNREEFERIVNGVLIAFLAPRLYLTALEQNNIISPKKALSGARDERGVTTT